MTKRYEGSDKGEEHEMVPVVIKNSNVNVVNNANSDSSKDDFENDNDNFFDEDIDNQVKVMMPQTTIDAKVVQAIKKLQASYNNDAQNHQTSNTRKKCHQKFKLSHQSCYGN